MVNVAGYQQAAKSLEKAGVNISGKTVSSKRQKEKRKERRRKREEAARKRLEAEAKARKAEAEATLKSGLVSPTSTVQMKDGKVLVSTNVGNKTENTYLDPKEYTELTGNEPPKNVQIRDDVSSPALDANKTYDTTGFLEDSRTAIEDVVDLVTKGDPLGTLRPPVETTTQESNVNPFVIPNIEMDSGVTQQDLPAFDPASVDLSDLPATIGDQSAFGFTIQDTDGNTQIINPDGTSTIINKVKDTVSNLGQNFMDNMSNLYQVASETDISVPNKNRETAIKIAEATGLDEVPGALEYIFNELVGAKPAYGSSAGALQFTAPSSSVAAPGPGMAGFQPLGFGQFVEDITKITPLGKLPKILRTAMNLGKAFLTPEGTVVNDQGSPITQNQIAGYEQLAQTMEATGVLGISGAQAVPDEMSALFPGVSKSAIANAYKNVVAEDNMVKGYQQAANTMADAGVLGISGTKIGDQDINITDDTVGVKTGIQSITGAQAGTQTGTRAAADDTTAKIGALTNLGTNVQTGVDAVDPVNTDLTTITNVVDDDDTDPVYTTQNIYGEQPVYGMRDVYKTVPTFDRFRDAFKGGIYDRFRDTYLTRFGYNPARINERLRYDPNTNMYFGAEGMQINPSSLDGAKLGEIAEVQTGEERQLSGQEQYQTGTTPVITGTQTVDAAGNVVSVNPFVIT